MCSGASESDQRREPTRRNGRFWSACGPKAGNPVGRKPKRSESPRDDSCDRTVGSLLDVGYHRGTAEDPPVPDETPAIENTPAQEPAGTLGMLPEEQARVAAAFTPIPEPGVPPDSAPPGYELH